MKNKLGNSFNMIEELGNSIQNLEKTEASNDVFISDKKFVNFSFNIEIEKVEFFRDFVLFKRQSSPEFFHYNNSNAVREGIALMMKNNPNLPKRPKEVKNSTRNGTTGYLGTVVKLKTSYRISEVDKDFIYNFIYYKSVDNPAYDKSAFIAELIGTLLKQYPAMKKATK